MKASSRAEKPPKRALVRASAEARAKAQSRVRGSHSHRVDACVRSVRAVDQRCRLGDQRGASPGLVGLLAEQTSPGPRAGAAVE